jgi:hypothetical protein
VIATTPRTVSICGDRTTAEITGWMTAVATVEHAMRRHDRGA